MAGPTKTKVLTLDRIYDHNVVKIEGKEYPLKNAKAIALLEMRWIEKTQPRIIELFNVDHPTSGDAEELSLLVDGVIRVILEAPDDVHRGLSDMERVQIIGFFSQRTEPAKKKRAAKKRAKKTRKRG